MPAFLGSLGGLLLSLVAGFVGRTLAALGLSLVTYYGVSQALDFLKGLIMQALSGFPVEVVQLLGLMRIGTALTIIFSAMFASMLLNGLNSDSFKKLIIQ
ncbi:DUF2523 domain-containing protein [Comamonas sp. Y6]|uniref:DUF2523 domain-containing protein n=1 Tax=Comamonas resistens TaxID=3046670 RepID=A0ABY8SQ13_9BURK|nr:DUF2523 domain-containing protein [Comamonas resistens]MDL5037524.1 DUF2523 domain-containing protein [Comamonas resistens]WHS64434.1 DUF2523 domain-containing protein [Comamonas resistens]